MNLPHTKHATFGAANPVLTYELLTLIAARRAREARRWSWLRPRPIAVGITVTSAADNHEHVPASLSRWAVASIVAGIALAAYLYLS